VLPSETQRRVIWQKFYSHFSLKVQGSRPEGERNTVFWYGHICSTPQGVYFRSQEYSLKCT